MEPTTPQGTTVAILQHYLDAGIEVEENHEDGHPTQRYLLTGIVSGHDGGAARVLDERLDIAMWRSPKVLLPVLKDFSDLVTPLADGSIPAIEVAKMAHGRENVPYAQAAFDRAVAKPQANGSIYVQVGFAGCIITPDWRVMWDTVGTVIPVQEQAAIIKYLYANHFAYSLHSSQYIRKQP